MQFAYDIDSGKEFLEISDEIYKYLIKARRHKVGDEVAFRNLEDNFLHTYKIENISRKSASLKLISKEEKIVKNEKELHLGWCMVDTKTVEKNIVYLNELGVSKISFIYCEYSQKNFTLNFPKLEKILINSSCQCGRSDIIELNICESLDEFLKQNPNSYFLDFSSQSIDEKKDEIKTLIIGCEGGFSQNERVKFDISKTVGFNSSLILKSETAIISATSKILL